MRTNFPRQADPPTSGLLARLRLERPPSCVSAFQPVAFLGSVQPWTEGPDVADTAQQLAAALAQALSTSVQGCITPHATSLRCAVDALKSG
jgi:hypothetical protein